METTTEKGVFHIKVYSKKELAAQLGFLSVKRFTTALRGIDEKEIKMMGRYYTPRQVETIIKHIGFDRITDNASKIKKHE